MEVLLTVAMITGRLIADENEQTGVCTYIDKHGHYFTYVLHKLLRMAFVLLNRHHLIDEIIWIVTFCCRYIFKVFLESLNRPPGT